MEAFLAPHAHAAEVGGDVVFLDERGDRYLCAPAGSGVVLCPDRRRLSGAFAGLAGDLAAEGLLAAAASASGPLPPRPRRDLPAGPVRLRAGDLAEAAVATADVLAAYGGRSLFVLLATARRRRGPAAGGPSPGMVRVAQAFRRWAPFTPLTAKCLLRSFMLLRALRRAGEDATWVFGVTTRPFSAHCWLQADDMALDDHWERLRRYEPILAV